MSDQVRSPASLPPTPANEKERLASLCSLDILDTESDLAFDNIVELARQITGEPVALITFIDEARQWFKAKVGFEECETSREDAFCAHALVEPQPMIIEDTLKDPRFAKHPFVTGAPKIRFYAGFPLILDEELALGTLCVFGFAPRRFSARERKSLSALSGQVVDQLRLRRALIDSERLRIEAAEHARELDHIKTQLAQAQKMKSLGRMAGGVAHDFNNILMVISSCADFLRQDLEPETQSHQDACDIADAAKSASALTRQLLAFSRSQALTPTVIELDEAISSMENMLRRILEADIELEVRIGGEGVCLYADKNQLEQVLFNLVINARDAVDPGGYILLETKRKDIAVGEKEHIPAGSYGVIEVTDDGAGIPADWLDKIFEPFFSSKTGEKGTGLGLATVQGVVSQSQGFVEVDSTTGEGTQFRIWFPSTELQSVPAPDVEYESRVDSSHPNAKPTILLVEDEPLVRKCLARVLSAGGFLVLEAEDGEAGLEVWKNQGGQIDAVVSDVVMPKMRGPEFVDKLRQMKPLLPVVFVTGYMDDSTIKTGQKAPTAVLHKPVKADVLAERLRQLLA